MTELPGMLELQQRVQKQMWPHTVDAMIWVDEWLKTITEHPEVATDRGAMLAWFAS